jgi:hypothetical protein
MLHLVLISRHFCFGAAVGKPSLQILRNRWRAMARTRTHWPPHVFDYVSQRVTDPDVAELDMAHGQWVRCGK